MHSKHYQKGHLPLIEPKPTFQAQTILIPYAEGVQVIATIAPQINIGVTIGIDQLQQALQGILTLRQKQGIDLLPINETTGSTN